MPESTTLIAPQIVKDAELKNTDVNEKPTIKSSSISLRPIDDNVILKEIEAPTQTASGLLLPEQRNLGKTREGIVVAVGPGKLYPDFTYHPMQLEIGDHVWFDRMSGTAIKYNGTEHTVITERSVLAVERGS